jgi:hypothetical protein
MVILLTRAFVKVATIRLGLDRDHLYHSAAEAALVLMSAFNAR